MRKTKYSIFDLANISLMVALIAICAWISVPSVVPFTLQTFGVFFALEMLGGKRGLTSILIYILVGAVGLPVFSGCAGGLAVLFGETGGYILGFALIGIVYYVVEIISTDKKARIAALSIGLIICYSFGTVWFVNVYTKSNATIGYGSAIALCVVPFIIPDAIKMALAIVIASRIRRAINK